MWVHMPQEHHGTKQDNYIKEISALTAEEILLGSMPFFFFFGVCCELGFCKQLDLIMQIIYTLHYCIPCLFFPKLLDIYPNFLS